MNDIPCLYAIVRFCPFIETEEFANVGVVLIAPEARYFGYKLMTKKHARVTSFFEQIDAVVFRAIIQNLKEELDRASKLFNEHGFDKRYKSNDLDYVRSLFLEIIKPRETVVKFGAMRGVLTNDPVEKLKHLYGYYVDRDFVTKEYRETVLERTMRRWIYDAGLSNRFEKKEVGNEDYYATFPFVEDGLFGPITAVKPLNLSQDQPNKILDHGGAWVFRVQTLKRRKLLPNKVLFAVEGPNDDGARSRAYRDMVFTLKEAGATVIDYQDKDDILNFITE